MDIYKCLKLISCQVFSPNCQKITWEHHGGCLRSPMPPMMGESWGTSETLCNTPMLIFSKNKNYLSNQMHTTTPPTSHHITLPPTPHNPPCHPTTHHPPPQTSPPKPPTPPKSTHTTTTTHKPPTPRTLQPPTMEKKWGLNA